MDKRFIASELLKIAKSLLATDFPSQEALDKYLKDHPDANKNNHKVVETKKEQPSKDDEDWSKTRNLDGKDFYMSYSGIRFKVDYNPKWGKGYEYFEPKTLAQKNKFYKIVKNDPKVLEHLKGLSYWDVKRWFENKNIGIKVTKGA